MGKASRKKAEAKRIAPSVGVGALVEFPRTVLKLEEARRVLERLAASGDVPEFRSHFSAFLSASRAITQVLQSEGAHVAGFGAWYEPKRVEMAGDDLLTFMHRTRRADFHQGVSPLVVAGTHVAHFSTDAVGAPPEPGATLEIGIEGPFCVLGKGTPRERRVPIRQGGAWSTTIALAGAPTSHRGKPIEHPDAITVCRLTLTYFEELVHEARSFRFGDG